MYTVTSGPLSSSSREGFWCLLGTPPPHYWLDLGTWRCSNLASFEPLSLTLYFFSNCVMMKMMMIDDDDNNDNND